ncbi:MULTISPECIES: helix-turn-helix domain-containing protein [unclassified Streptosporangium]|uniref:helix-turn-helix domain-containing protein n=1 Tax=unclassified Streptosporangium TaxID=2632669 RepID=UPI002E2B9A10|nr:MULTISPECIES: helix-turn-helix transcriptional regulator [unclassified Streptosporangium]
MDPNPSVSLPKLAPEHTFAMERNVLGNLLQQAILGSGLTPSQIATQVRIPASTLSAMMSGRMIPRKETLESIVEACEAVPMLRFDIRYSWERLRDLQLRSEQPSEIESSETENSDPPAPHSGGVHAGTAFQEKDSLHRLREDAFGYGLKPDPLTATTKEELLELMRDFQIWAGEPSYREIAINAGRTVGASTLCEALDVNKPARLPSLKVVTAFIHGCGGSEEDLTHWTTSWRRIRMGRTQSNITRLPGAARRHAG